MKTQLNKARDWYEGLVTRERWLVLAMAVVLVALIMDTVLITPAGKAIKQKQAALTHAEESLKTSQLQLDTLNNAANSNPLASKEAEQNALQKQVSVLESRFKELSEGLISASSLPKILEEMLQQAGNLSLQEMIVEPPEAKISGLYKHAVSVKLSGDFFSVINYLKALEKLNWNFYWEELNYSVHHYPAEVELKVYTLSSKEAAI